MSTTHNHTTKHYQNGCRCDECRALNTILHYEWRIKRTMRLDELPPDKHGTNSTFTNWGCRDECPRNPTTGLSCRDAHNAWSREYQARRRREATS